MEAKHCPMCQASTVLVGSVYSEGGALAFAPTGSHVPLWGLNFPLRWNTCLSCGNVWTSVNVQGVRAAIEASGSELLKQQVERLDHGPHHDVPSVPGALKASERVAEIDDLFLAGKEVEATRRFHELTGCTWDETVDSLRGWRQFKRAKKLALFGWQTEKKPAAAGAGGTSEHPMADRWLDGLPAAGTPPDGPSS
jgi:hypothetical protein